MEEIKMKQNIFNLLEDGNSIIKNKSKPNRHVSVLYGIQYVAQVPLVKKCRITQKDCFANIDKKKIFTLVHKFIQKLLASDQLLIKVLNELKFVQNQIQKAPIQIQVLNSGNKKISILCDLNLNKEGKHKKQQKKISMFRDFLEDQFKKSSNPKSCKKISIMFDDTPEFDVEDDSQGNNDQKSSKNFSSGSVIFSSQTLTGISSINIKEQQFTLKMVQRIFQQPQPFLINLSVCLMLKFLKCSGLKLTSQNVCWILSIGTIVAYKIYYDQPVQGLVDSFAYILKVKTDDIVNLQRFFLSSIDYLAVISNQQYHSVLCYLINQWE